MPAKLENSAVATGMEKVSLNSNPKECSNCCTIALISHASKVMLKILQARLQQYVNQELPDVQAGFGKEIAPPILNSSKHRSVDYNPGGCLTRDSR